MEDLERRGVQEGFKRGLADPIALDGFQKDMHALAKCDLCVLVLPCGKSAHLEAGWAARDDDKNVIVYIPKLEEAELMYLMLGPIVDSKEDLAKEIEELSKNPRKVISFQEHVFPCFCHETNTRNCPRHQNT